MGEAAAFDITRRAILQGLSGGGAGLASLALASPGSGRARVSTRIRLAKPQDVLAVAEMSDGALLLTRTRVKVDINGCA